MRRDQRGGRFSALFPLFNNVRRPVFVRLTVVIAEHMSGAAMYELVRVGHGKSPSFLPFSAPLILVDIP